MTYQAEVKHKLPERFRAYAHAPMTRKPTADDRIALAKRGLRFVPGQRVGYQVEEVEVEGEVSGLAVHIDSEKLVTRVVFYAGPVEEEMTVGAIDIGAAGAIDIALNFVKDEPEDDLEVVKGDVVSESDVKGD